MATKTSLAAIVLAMLFTVYAQNAASAASTDLPKVDLVDFPRSFVEWNNNNTDLNKTTIVRTQIIAIAEVLDSEKKVQKRFLLLERYQGEKMWAKDFLFYTAHGQSYSFFFIADVEACEFLILRNPVSKPSGRYQHAKCGYDGKTILSLQAILPMVKAVDVTSRQLLKSASKMPRQLVGVSEKDNLRLTYPIDSYNYYVEGDEAIPQIDTGELLYFKTKDYSFDSIDIAFLGYNEDLTEFNFQKPEALKGEHWYSRNRINYGYGDIRREEGWKHKIYLLERIW